MDHFFNSVATLMSNLLRSCVTNSIYDLVDLVEEYWEGNKYEGEYDIMKGLALPQKLHPVTFFMVSREKGLLPFVFTSSCPFGFTSRFFFCFCNTSCII